MSLSITSGFVVPKMQNIEISSDDMQKYGITPEDFAKVDKNGDGLITASEFMSNGMGVVSIFNAYKTLAISNGAYVEPAQQLQMQAQNNNPNGQNGQNQYSLTHPGVKNSFDFYA